MLAIVDFTKELDPARFGRHSFVPSGLPRRTRSGSMATISHSYAWYRLVPQ